VSDAPVGASSSADRPGAAAGDRQPRPRARAAAQAAARRLTSVVSRTSLGPAAVGFAREEVVGLLAAHDAGDALHMVEGLEEMAADTERISDEESHGLQSESRAARALDQRLAGDLRQGRLGGATSSAGYLRELGERPRLPVAVERRLVGAAQDGDRQAREQLVEAFLPLIAGVARVYRGSKTISRLELMQEGVVGLLRALERYDPRLGAPFWGYAAWWVRQAMQQLVAELTRPMVLSDRALRALSRLRRAHAEYVAEHGREPTAAELAERSGIPVEQVAELLALERVPQSLEEHAGGEAGQLGAFGELLVDPLASDAYEQLLDHSELEQIRALLGSLNDRERMILRARYGLDGPEQSLRDVGEQIGLSGERVRQIEQRALGKLRAAAPREIPG
jgi:RNA polymerase primary sigma factor